MIWWFSRPTGHEGYRARVAIFADRALYLPRKASALVTARRASKVDLGRIGGVVRTDRHR